MANNKKLKTVMSLVVALVILYLIYSRMNFYYFLKVVKDMNVWYFFIAILFGFMGFPIVAYRWQLLLKNMGLRVKAYDLTIITVLFYFSNCILPAKLGEIYRCYLIKKNYGFPGSKVLGGIFVERLIDVILLAGIFALLSLVYFQEYFNVFYVVVVFVLVLMSAVYFIIKYNTSILGKLPVFLKDKFKNFQEGMQTCVKKSNVIQLLLLSMFRWFMTIIPIYFVFLALHIELSLVIITFLIVVSTLVSIIPITPSGMGVSELTIIGILVMVGITRELAIATSFVIRFVNYWLVLIVGGVVYLGSDKK